MSFVSTCNHQLCTLDFSKPRSNCALFQRPSFAPVCGTRRLVPQTGSHQPAPQVDREFVRWTQRFCRALALNSNLRSEGPAELDMAWKHEPDVSRLRDHDTVRIPARTRKMCAIHQARFVHIDESARRERFPRTLE